MKFIKPLSLLAIVFLIASCGSKLPENYHLEKKYWAVSDYEDAIRYMKYTLKKEEGYPRLSDPVTAPVFVKMVDKQNVTVVLGDENLGLRHRDNVADGFWDVSKDLLHIYGVLDIQDKYIYPMELVQVFDFFLHTQLLYFKVGNDKILKDAVDPNASDVKCVVRNNQQTLVNNFNLNLDYLVKDAFSPDAADELAMVMNEQFGILINEYPNANYGATKKKIKLIIQKTDSERVRSELEKLKTLLDSK